MRRFSRRSALSVTLSGKEKATNKVKYIDRQRILRHLSIAPFAPCLCCVGVDKILLEIEGLADVEDSRDYELVAAFVIVVQFLDYVT